MRLEQIGPVRAALLVALALATVAVLVTYVALVASGPSTPEDVAREVVQAVADDDCDDLDDLLADDADLPSPVTACRRGVPSPVELDDVEVIASTVDGDESAVTVALTADGQGTEVVVRLRRTDEQWRVTAIRPAAG